MEKSDAIKWFKNIQNGEGVDRDSFSDEMKGDVAKWLWDEATFAYGIEYGVLIALQKIYGITQETLERYNVDKQAEYKINDVLYEANRFEKKGLMKNG